MCYIKQVPRSSVDLQKSKTNIWVVFAGQCAALHGSNAWGKIFIDPNQDMHSKSLLHDLSGCMSQFFRMQWGLSVRVEILRGSLAPRFFILRHGQFWRESVDNTFQQSVEYSNNEKFRFMVSFNYKWKVNAVEADYDFGTGAMPCFAQRTENFSFPEIALLRFIIFYYRNFTVTRLSAFFE